jgi:hypothetical protein
MSSIHNVCKAYSYSLNFICKIHIDSLKVYFAIIGKDKKVDKIVKILPRANIFRNNNPITLFSSHDQSLFSFNLFFLSVCLSFFLSFFCLSSFCLPLFVHLSLWICLGRDCLFYLFIFLSI